MPALCHSVSHSATIPHALPLFPYSALYVLLIPVCCTHRLKYSGSAAVLVARWGRSQAGASVAKDRPKKKPSVSLAVVEEEEADKGEEEEEPQPEQTSGTKNKRARSETPTACSRKRTLGTQRASRDSDRPQPVQVVVEQTHSINSLRGGPLLHCEWGADCGCQARTSSATTALLLGCLVSDPQATAGSHGKGHMCALRR